MRTQVMHERAAGLPWLEHYPVDGGPPQQTALDDFPFVIGRNEDSDLSIDSSQISRRHVEILCDEDGYRLRDLGSTNGTFLNGRQIDEAQLHDGDLFVVADVELTFFAGRTSDAPDMATQAIDFRQSWGVESEASWELMRVVRRLDEILAHRAVVVRFMPILELEGGEVFAYRLCEAGDPRASGGRDLEQLILKTDCRLSGRYRRLKRILAVEQSVELPERTALFLTLDEVEIGDESLGESLEQLAEAIPSTRPLVAVVSQRAVSDVAYFRRLFGRLRTAGIRLAYDCVAGKLSAAINQMQLRPDYLILAESLARDIHRNPRQQRIVEAILRASRDCGGEVIATALGRREDAAFCCRLGCRYGQGELYRHAEPVPAAEGCLTN
jgi:EAL domain-containing protein (putative c-di-GMP-specific phosphodiesterase class I)